MEAVVLHRFGGPEELTLEEIPDLEPGPGQVRVAVSGAGVNPVDTGNRSDGAWAGLEVPCVLGYDVAGVVEKVGGGVEGVAVGDHVMAMTEFPRGVSGYAELVVTQADLVAVIDRGLDLVQAAAIPLAAGTAWDVLGRLALPPAARSWCSEPAAGWGCSSCSSRRTRAWT